MLPNKRNQSAPRGIRIPVNGLKGRRPRPLDDGGATLPSISETPSLRQIPNVSISFCSQSLQMCYNTCHMADEKDNRRSLLKRVMLPAVSTVILIAIAITLQQVYGDRLQQLALMQHYVYLGAFLISLIGNATVVLPVAVLAILTSIGIMCCPVTGVYGPVMVGLAGGAGAALGEITGYMVGFSGRGVAEKSRFYHRVEGWMQRWGIIIVLIFSLVPFFFDLVGIIAGALRLPLWKFVLFCWLGRSIMYVGVIVAVSMGYQSILPFFS